MNNSQRNTLQSSTPPSNLDGIAEGAFAMGGLFFLIAFLIFVLWIWSMISMISLNRKFDKFLELYKEAEFEEVSTNKGDGLEERELSESEIEAARVAGVQRRKRLQLSVATVGILIVVLLVVVWLIG